MPNLSPDSKDDLSHLEARSSDQILVLAGRQKRLAELPPNGGLGREAWRVVKSTAVSALPVLGGLYLFGGIQALKDLKRLPNDEAKGLFSFWTKYSASQQIMTAATTIFGTWSYIAMLGNFRKQESATATERLGQLKEAHARAFERETGSAIAPSLQDVLIERENLKDQIEAPAVVGPKFILFVTLAKGLAAIPLLGMDNFLPKMFGAHGTKAALKTAMETGQFTSKPVIVRAGAVLSGLALWFGAERLINKLAVDQQKSSATKRLAVADAQLGMPMHDPVTTDAQPHEPVTFHQEKQRQRAAMQAATALAV